MDMVGHSTDFVYDTALVLDNFRHVEETIITVMIPQIFPTPFRGEYQMVFQVIVAHKSINFVKINNLRGSTQIFRANRPKIPEIPPIRRDWKFQSILLVRS